MPPHLLLPPFLHLQGTFIHAYKAELYLHVAFPKDKSTCYPAERSDSMVGRVHALAPLCRGLLRQAPGLPSTFNPTCQPTQALCTTLSSTGPHPPPNNCPPKRPASSQTPPALSLPVPQLYSAVPQNSPRSHYHSAAGFQSE